MRATKFASVLVGLSLAVSSAALAQTVTVKATAPNAPGGGTVTAFGYYMSPYSGTVDGGPTLRFNCVDFFHDINIGDSWSATAINLGAAITSQTLLAGTRNGTSGVVRPLTGLTSLLSVYEQAAWLTDQFAANPATSPNQSAAIQSAIWYVASEYGGASNYSGRTNQYWNGGSATSTLVNNGSTSTGYWVNQAQSFVTANGNNAAYFDKFEILAPTTSAGQEFIYSTPEPATLSLMATGLLSLTGFAAKRRKRRVAGPDVPEAAA